MLSELLTAMKITNSSGKFLFDAADKRIRFVAPGRRIYDVDMRGVNLDGFCIENVLFEGGDFERAQVVEARIKATVFEGSWICEMNCSSSAFEIVEFYDVQAYGARLDRASLSEVKFLGSNLSNSSFVNVDMRDVFFGKDNVGHKTDLSGVDFRGSRFFSVKFEGAVFDGQTHFPQDFDPRSVSGLSVKQA